MAKHFDLKKQLRLHDKGLLRRLFAEHGELLDFPWEGFLPKNIDRLFAAWEAIDGSTQRTIQVILQDAHELSGEHGQRVLSEELGSRYPEKLQVFTLIRGGADRALWAYLEAREAFDEAALFARAEALRSGQRAAHRISLAPRPIAATDATRAAPEGTIPNSYSNKQLGGPACHEHNYRRPVTTPDRLDR
jgi:hypothetical protein